MIDRNNLNRIKGILSAKTGAEIPKYNPGGTIPQFNINDVDFQKWAKQIGTQPNPTTWGQYQSLKQTVPGASIEQLISYTTGDAKLPNGEDIKKVLYGNQTTMSIPGANPNESNPNAAVENSAKTLNAVENQQIQHHASNINQEQIKAKSIKVESATGLSSGLNEVKSSGLNLTEEQSTLANTNKINLSGVVGQIGTAAFNGIGTAVGTKQSASDSDLTKGISTAYDAAAGVAENFGPVGKIVGTAMKTAKVAGDIIQELGGGTDQQTTTDKWMDSPLFSWNVGMINGFAGKNTQDFGVDQDVISQVGSSYGGTVDAVADAAEKAGKKYGLFSTKARKKADAAINKVRSQQTLMGDISDTATNQRLAVQSMGEQAGLAYSLMIDGGYNQKYTYAAKHGGLLEWNPVIEWEPQIELNWELPTFKKGGNIDIVEELEWIPEFKSGGKTEESNIPEIEETTQKNVIPEGALHKNKHHMEHAEGLTKKGIPVIDDDGEQQAEIEHSEIIFTLEVTKKLEEYYEIFYSDESSNKEKEQAALDAGKLLVYQILENTEDRTGLIDSCKQGGSLTLKKSTEDLIEEALEWMPTIIVEIEESEKKSVEKKSDKEQLKDVIKEVLIELLIK